MKGCPYEGDVIAAGRKNRWTETLRDHLSGCLGCAETALVIDVLARDARELADEAPPLPDPKIIWIRSRLAERRRHARLSDRAAVWVQRMVLVVVCGVGLGFTSDLGRLFSAARGLVSIPESFSIPWPIAGPTAVMVVTAIVAALMAAWTDRTAGRGSWSG